MSRRFQFSLKWLFVAMLTVACFFGGIRLERNDEGGGTKGQPACKM